MVRCFFTLQIPASFGNVIHSDMTSRHDSPVSQIMINDNFQSHLARFISIFQQFRGYLVQIRRCAVFQPFDGQTDIVQVTCFLSLWFHRFVIFSCDALHISLIFAIQLFSVFIPSTRCHIEIISPVCNFFFRPTDLICSY